MTGLTGNNAITGAGYRKNQPPYEIDQSLRFNDGDSAYLNRTAGTATSNDIGTLSFWAKRGEIGGGKAFFSNHSDANNRTYVGFDSDTIQMYGKISGSTNVELVTTPVFRDPSAWYHIVIAVDVTQSTASNRVKIYVNGSQVTDFSTSTYPAQNTDLPLFSKTNMQVGAFYSSSVGDYYDGYLAEYNYIDGQALTPASFGETLASTNQWVPIAYEGSYGANGFYLDFSIGSGYTQFTSTGSNTWTCPTGVTSIDVLVVGGGGGGGRNSLQGGGGGAGGLVYAENYSVTPGVEYDITIGAGGAGTTGTATNGANGSDTVFNVNAEGGGATITAIGGGGGAGYHEGSNGGSGGGGQPVRNGGNATQGDSGGGTGYGNNGAAGYTGGGTDDHGGGGGGAGAAGTAAVTNKAGNGGIGRYYGYRFGDSVGDSGYFAGGGGGGTRQQASAIGIGGSGGGGNGQFNGEGNEDGQANTGGGGGGGSANDSGGDGGSGTVILVPSTVSFIGSDSSGNGNNFTATNITATDELLDSPSNNFATLNPLHWGIRNAAGSVPLSEGNLKFTGSDSVSVYGTWYATFEVPSSSGWYFEMVPTAIGSAEKQSQSLDVGGIRFKANGETNSGSYGSAWSAGDIIGVAINSSGVWFSINNTWQNSGNPATGSNAAGTPSLPGTILTGDGSATTNSSLSGVLNFGQDSSFAGNKTAQGNTDGNGIGDFYYTPPTGFKALCTDNLSDPSIADPTAHFNTVLYTGNGSNPRSITGVGFQPDFHWRKKRNAARSHNLHDVVRGAPNFLYSDATAAAVSTDGNGTLSSFDSDGFTFNSEAGDENTNNSGDTYVTWNWKAGGTASSNSDGSITSSVSANPTAGFSIVNWNGTEASATIGHGLSQAPELIIVKDVDTAGRNWPTNIENITGTANQYLFLNATDSAATSSAYWGGTPGASVFTVGDSANTNDDASMIAYCFHSVEGYSKLGSYTGNGSSDGVFIYTGFRPAWFMCKRTNSTNQWTMADSIRSPYNVADDILYANLSDAETTSDAIYFDFVSNGIKLRSGTAGNVNTSGSSYIYLAFAESPFKYSNAR